MPYFSSTFVLYQPYTHAYTESRPLLKSANAFGTGWLDGVQNYKQKVPNRRYHFSFR